MSFHVRRQDREITDPAVMRQILRTAKSMTIALCMNNEPYLVSLSPGYDETHNRIYFHCAPEGKKIVYMKSNNKIWGQAIINYKVKDDCSYSYSCVHFSGKVTLVENFQEKRKAMECMIRQLSKNPEEKLALLKSEKLRKTGVGRIDIEYMTCKKTKI